MSEMEELRCYIAFDERSNGKDRDDHHERGKPGALFAISKIDFHGFWRKWRRVLVRSSETYVNRQA
jgi:hypothetical protein